MEKNLQGPNALQVDHHHKTGAVKGDNKIRNWYGNKWYKKNTWEEYYMMNCVNGPKIQTFYYMLVLTTSTNATDLRISLLSSQALSGM